MMGTVSRPKHASAICLSAGISHRTLWIATRWSISRTWMRKAHLASFRQPEAVQQSRFQYGPIA